MFFGTGWSFAADPAAGTAVVKYSNTHSVTLGVDPEEATLTVSGTTVTVKPKDAKKGITRIGLVATGPKNYFTVSANSLTGLIVAKAGAQAIAQLIVDPKRCSISSDPSVDISDETTFGYVVRGSDTAIEADDPVESSVYSTQVDRIEWLCPSGELLVGTTGGEFTIGETTTVDPFGPENCKVVPATAYGSSPIQALQVGAVLLFVQRAGRKLREFIFDSLGENYKASDVAVAAEHVTVGGL